MSERLGHSGVGITFNTYSHILPGMQEDGARRLDQADSRYKALSSRRIPDWTRMTGEELSSEWLRLFEQDEDLARETALRECERMVRDKCEASQERLYRIKRSLVGWHARSRLDQRYEERGLEGVWWTRRDEAMTEFEYADLPLPFKGLVRMLKYLACRRARIRPCDL